MYLREKEILVTLIGLILIPGFYSLYVYYEYVAVNSDILNDFTFWGKVYLILIPVSIVTQIIIHIIFFTINKIVTNECPPDITDERDKLIELKAIRLAHWTFIAGFILSMASLAIGMQPWVMLITLIYSGFIAAIVSESAKIYFYRKGF